MGALLSLLTRRAAFVQEEELPAAARYVKRREYDIEPRTMEKILIIKLGALGDFVLAIGSMMEVRRRHPSAELTLMTGSPYLPVARQMEIFSRYIVDNRVSYFNIREQRRLLSEVIRGNFDLIYDIQGVRRTKYKYFPVLRWFMPRSFGWVHAYGQELWQVKKIRRRSFGCLEVKAHPMNHPCADLSFLHGENEHFAELPVRFVLMIPGCSPNHPYKRWPVENYAALAKMLAARGIASVLIGTHAEAAEIRAIEASSPMVVSMLNKTSLLDVPDLARRALATVGNDTGPSHMASLAGAPTIAIYDYRTRSGALQGPNSVNLVSQGVIGLVTVGEVWEKLAAMLKEKGVE